MNTARHAAVIGAGPSGLALALMLARDGWRVSVHERFEQARPVGAGFMLQPTGLAVLDALDLTESISRLGQPIHRLFGRAAPSGRIVLDVSYAHLRRPRPALAVHRAAMFHVLYEAALAAGVAALTGRRITAAGDGRLTDAQGRAHGPFDLIVDASGAGSPVARALGARPRPLTFGALWTTVPWIDQGPFDPHALEQVYRRAEVMIGVLPCGRRPSEPAPLATFFWSLKTEDHAAWRARGLAAWKGEVLGFWPQTMLDSITDPDALTLARYGHHTLSRPASDRLAVIGDAAHSTSPQLGQGVNMGLLDAWALADSLRLRPDVNEALALYARRRRWHVRLYQALSLGFTPFYQSTGRGRPWVRDHLLGRAARAPFAPRLLAATVGGLLLDPRPPG